MINQNYWRNWENDVIEIFAIALSELREMKDLPLNEDEINRKLAIVLRKARRDFMKTQGREVQGVPFYHGKGQPENMSQKMNYENKVPEFMWTFTDMINNEDKDFTVECKRLGKEKSHFCKEYVVNGILRFIKEEWSYGKQCESGLMIGYIQNLEFNEIHDSVNQYSKKSSIPALTLKGKWVNGGISKLNHQLKRPKVPISPFDLNHIWVDLRN